MREATSFIPACSVPYLKACGAPQALFQHALYFASRHAEHHKFHPPHAYCNSERHDLQAFRYRRMLPILVKGMRQFIMLASACFLLSELENASHFLVPRLSPH